MCCVSFTVVGAQYSCLVYDVRCLLLFDCLYCLVLVWCCVGIFFSMLCVVRCVLFLVCCVMFEVCVASWRYVLFVSCCVYVVVCRVGFGVVTLFFVASRCLLLLLVIRCVLIGVLVFVVCCLMAVVCWLFFGVRRCSFVVSVCLLCDVGFCVV